MNPHTGDVFELRQELVPERPGEPIDTAALRARLAELVTDVEALDPTVDELAAARQETLIAVSQEAAAKLKLGERERERRKRRRKASSRARRSNRP